MKQVFLKIKTVLENLVQLTGAKGALFYIILGALTSLSFAPTGLFLLVFISFPLLVRGLDFSTTKGRAFYIGGWFALGLFSAGLHWVGFSFLAQTDVPAWGGYFAVLALAVALSLFVALGFVVAQFFWRKSALRILLFAIVWAVFEWLRGHMFTGLPWHLMAQIWSDTPVIMQSLSIVGSYGLSFLTVFVAASPALFFNKLNVGRYYIFISAALISSTVLVFGGVRLQQAEVSYFPDVRLRLVQANVPQLEKWTRENWSRNVNRHIGLSVDSWPEGGAPTHIIWPETAVPYYLDSRPDVRADIMEALGGSVHLITGTPRLVRADSAGGVKNTQLYNSIVALSPDAEVSMTYDKSHLVPFGEYVPLYGLLEAVGVTKMVAGSVGFSSGSGVKTENISGLPSFSPLICYEIIFPNFVRLSDAKWILNLTNDAWFGESFGPYQHFAQARFRAVEEGVSVVRVAGTGISAVIDPWGRVQGQINLAQQGYLDAKLPKPSLGLTPYSQYGDIIFLALFLFSLGALTALLRRE